MPWTYCAEHSSSDLQLYLAAMTYDDSVMDKDILPDLTQELASISRGAMQRRIMQLEAELKETYRQIHELNNQVQVYKMKEILAKAAADDIDRELR